LAYKTCHKELLRKDTKKPGNFEIIPVRPNWHDSTELMGYVSRINGEKYITTSFLQFIAKAWRNIDVPFFLCLDEMNLAPVEQYFAEYLSIIETRQIKGKKIVTDYLISKASFEEVNLYSKLLVDLGLDDVEFQDGISIPNNLVVIGTVNMDETTHSFSRKVLDRAMTFEMNDVDLTAGLDNSKNDWSYPQTFISSEEVIGEFTSGAEVVNEFAESKRVIDFLINLNTELEGTPFKIAFRVRDEFLIYCYYASLDKSNPNWLTNALDEMTSMKILSRIEGDEGKTSSVLSKLQKILTVDYKRSNTKLKEMEARLSTSGYTSFWS
jgi:5-methylcytosine-specific restriction endonuclease McrBC GTP-binding regulatory subunit McrB